MLHHIGLQVIAHRIGIPLTRLRTSCTPSGVASPTASANCQPFLRSTGASKPRREARARRRGSGRPNRGAIRSTTPSRPSAQPCTSVCLAMLDCLPAEVTQKPGCSIRIDVPEYLVRELRVRCAEDKVTIAYLVMAALRKDGFHIEERLGEGSLQARKAVKRRY